MALRRPKHRYPIAALPPRAAWLATPLAACLLATAGFAAPIQLGGLLPIDPREASWPWCGTWVAPVGDSCEAGAGDPPYTVNRGLEWNAAGQLTHRGADLCNRRGGGTVRAAAHGVVIHASNDAGGAYGALVVLAHRSPDSTLAYTVYAHLEPGSIPVEAGAAVEAGRAIGRVGRSGNASTDHLHFEVRLPEDPELRWEKCPTADPVAFVASRRSCRADAPAWARPSLEWAERSALIEPRRSAGEPLTRRQWWRMLAALALGAGAAQAPDLESSLAAAGLLEEAGAAPDEPIDWKEAAAGLERLRDSGARGPAFAPAAGHRAVCEDRLRAAEPSRRPERLARNPARPTLADACLALADLCARDEHAMLGSQEP